VLPALFALSDLCALAALWRLLAPPAPSGLAADLGGLVLCYAQAAASVACRAGSLALRLIGLKSAPGLAAATVLLPLALFALYLLLLVPLYLGGVSLVGAQLL